MLNPTRNRAAMSNSSEEGCAVSIVIFSIIWLIVEIILLLTVGFAHSDQLYHFWGGFWHGTIIPISFIFSLFREDVVIYACNNNGALYDLGFALSIGLTVIYYMTIGRFNR